MRALDRWQHVLLAASGAALLGPLTVRLHAAEPPAAVAPRVPEETVLVETDAAPFTTKSGLVFKLRLTEHKHGKEGTTGYYDLEASWPGGSSVVELVHSDPEDWYGEWEAAGRLVRLLGMDRGKLKVELFPGPAPARLTDEELVARVEAQLAARGIATGGMRSTRVGETAVSMTLIGTGHAYWIRVVAGTRTGELLHVGDPGPPPRLGSRLRIGEDAWSSRAGFSFRLALKAHKHADDGGSHGSYELAWKGKGAAGKVKLGVSGAADWFRELVLAGQLVRLMGRDTGALLIVILGPPPKKKKVDALVEAAAGYLAALGRATEKGLSSSEDLGAIHIRLMDGGPLKASTHAVVGPWTGDLLWVGWDAD